jgi:hypothetical protein
MPQIADVVVDKQPHHFEWFKNAINCKSYMLIIIGYYFSSFAGDDVDLDTQKSLLKSAVNNITVKLRNDFFYGKKTNNQMNKNLREYLSILLSCLHLFFFSGNVELSIAFVNYFISLDGVEMLSELFSFINSPSTTSSLSTSLRFCSVFSTSPIIRIPPEMIDERLKIILSSLKSTLE